MCSRDRWLNWFFTLYRPTLVPVHCTFPSRLLAAFDRELTVANLYIQFRWKKNSCLTEKKKKKTQRKLENCNELSKFWRQYHSKSIKFCNQLIWNIGIFVSTIICVTKCQKNLLISHGFTRKLSEIYILDKTIGIIW